VFQKIVESGETGFLMAHAATWRNLAFGLFAVALVLGVRADARSVFPSMVHRGASVTIEQALLISIAVGLAIALTALIFRAHGMKVMSEKIQKSRDLAAVRERERDMAQQELLRKLEEERELAKEKMQFESQLAEYEKFASLAQLALGAAHEINNPLLGIMSHLELELGTVKDNEERAEIEQCIEGTKRISSAVRGLLNYARPGPLILSKVSFDRLVAETVHFLEHQPMFRNIRLVRQIAPDFPPISADINQVSQILMNLVLNSAQAMEHPGTITIAADKLAFEELVEIRVTDTGCGIPADILPHVFEQFFSTKRGKGTGLGLSICQAYVRTHGGDIRLDSEPGHGTTVRVRLPIRQQSRPSPEKAEEVVV
jgi:signal transduction histidine kinase